jgi:hypothetical protein
MKRFIQIVALVVVAFLAAQPLANASCPFLLCSSGHSALKCCEHAGGMQLQGMSSDETMDSMRASCEMQQRDALAKPVCGDGCCTALARPTPPYVADIMRLLSGDASLVLPLDGPVQAAEARSRTSGAASAPAAVNHALFRALRI